MVHSVELLFDPDTEAAIRGIWDALAAVGVKSPTSHQHVSNRPHVTLAVAERMDGAVDEALRPLAARLPLACSIGAPMLFGRGPFVLVRLVVPSAELLAFHADVHAVCVPHMAPGPVPHADPGHWTPHVTLARRVPADLLPAAFGVRGLGRDRRATAVGLRHWDGNARIEHPIR